MEPGTYMATVTVTDGRGAFDTAEVEVTVSDPPGNRPPSVQIAAAPRSGPAPLPVRFTSAARDPDGDPLLVEWDFGDGGRAGGRAVTHVYTMPGTYTATVTVTDPGGATGTGTVQIVVTGPQAGLGSLNVASFLAPEPPAFVGLTRPARTSVAAFARRGLKVTLTCSGAMTGKASLKTTRRTARKLNLQRTTLARRTVRCHGAGSKTVRLKPKRAVRRTLSKTRGPIKTTLAVRMRAADGSIEKTTRKLKLTRG
jgi:hypothetical protein